MTTKIDTRTAGFEAALADERTKNAALEAANALLLTDRKLCDVCTKRAYDRDLAAQRVAFAALAAEDITAAGELLIARRGHGAKNLLIGLVDVISFAVASTPAVRQVIYECLDVRVVCEIKMKLVEDSRLPQWIGVRRVPGSTITCTGSRDVDAQQAKTLRDAGIPVKPRRTLDDRGRYLPREGGQYEGTPLDAIEQLTTAAEWDATMSVDTELVGLVSKGIVKVRVLSPDDVRALILRKDATLRHDYAAYGA